jgi:hypothetical protein
MQKPKEQLDRVTIKKSNARDLGWAFIIRGNMILDELDKKTLENFRGFRSKKKIWQP